MSEIAIYVQGHTKLPFLFVDSYYPIIRGMSRDSVREEILVDTVGDNISDKENMPDFNFLYWIWKNTDIPEYIGVCQYRRYFNFSGEKLKPDGSNFFDCVKALRAVDLLKHADVILLHLNAETLKCNMAAQSFRWHKSKYMFLAYKVICRNHPEYRSSFLKVMDCNVFHARCIFVTKRQIFYQFMEFFSTVLFDLENIAIKDYFFEKQSERFLSYVYERLMEVFWVHNKFRIKECKLIQLSLDQQQ